MLNIGDKAPDFILESNQNNKVSLSDFLGKSEVILYFYPKDNTSGCTKEACSFRDNVQNIEAKNATIIGVSPDNVESHQKFIHKYELNFLLLSDPDHKLAEDYGVWAEKNMYGKKYWGIKRTTFIIGKDGIIKHVFKKVKTAIHGEEVLDILNK